MGSRTVSSGYAGSAKKPSLVNSAAPYSPCLAITTRGPIAQTAAAAFMRLGSSVSMRSSSSFMSTMSTTEMVWQQRVARVLDPEVHRVERGELRPGALLANVALEVRLDVGQEQQVRLRASGELRLEVAEHAQLRVERVAVFRSQSYSQA